MNTKIAALTLAAATAFAFTPKPAVAGDGAAVVGGILGGLIIGAAIANADDCTPVYVNTSYCAPAGGYWDTVSTNVWVPGYWVVERDYCGRAFRRYVAGHYECRTERVWVAYSAPTYYGGYGRGRDISRGYGHDRDYRHDRYDRRDDRRDDRRNHR